MFVLLNSFFYLLHIFFYHSSLLFNLKKNFFFKFLYQILSYFLFLIFQHISYYLKNFFTLFTTSSFNIFSIFLLRFIILDSKRYFFSEIFFGIHIILLIIFSNDVLYFNFNRLKNPHACPFHGQRNDSCNCVSDLGTVSGKTMFKRVRIDPARLYIIGKDNCAHTSLTIVLNIYNIAFIIQISKFYFLLFIIFFFFIPPSFFSLLEPTHSFVLSCYYAFCYNTLYIIKIIFLIPKILQIIIYL